MFPFIPVALGGALMAFLPRLFKTTLVLVALAFSAKATLYCFKEITTQDKTYLVFLPFLLYYLCLSCFVICL